MKYTLLKKIILGLFVIILSRLLSDILSPIYVWYCGYVAGALVLGIFLKIDELNKEILDLWTELPPEGEIYEFITHYGDIDWAVSQENDWDKFRVKTNNCHKTHQSAKEALKRLLS